MSIPLSSSSIRWSAAARKRLRKIGVLALVVPTFAFAIAACGGSSTRDLKVEAYRWSLIDDQNATGPPILVPGVGGGLLYAQASCPDRQGNLLPRYRLLDLGTGRTKTYPYTTSVVAGARGHCW